MSGIFRSSIEQFSDLAGRLVTSHTDIGRLDEAALMLAATFTDNVDFSECRGRLDSLADAVAPLISRVDSDESAVQVLLNFLSRDIGFRGNFDDYYEPRNSFLHEVLVRRVGIPLSLSIVYLEVGRRIGLQMEGVNFPGHFLIRYRGQEAVWVDPFYARTMNTNECVAWFAHAVGREDLDNPDDFGAASTLEILIRMASNLKRIYTQRGDMELALIGCDALVRLRPQDPREVRDRGFIYEQLERPSYARKDFEHFLALQPHGDSSAEIRARVEGLKGKREMLN